MNVINQARFIKNYKFTYTSEDVYNFNEAYYKNYGYRPFTDTSSSNKSEFSNIDINTDDIKKFLDYSLSAYDEFNEGELVESDNSQAVIFNEEDELIIAFRGTEIDSDQELFLGVPEDIITDFKTDIELSSNLGWVGIQSEKEDVMIHKGFADYIDIIYDEIVEKHVINNTTKKIYICGHSLGSVSAQIFAYRLFLDMRSRGVEINIVGVYGYGGVKGMFSPYNSIDNYLNIYSIFHYKDPVPYWFPIYGDQLGTKIILYEDSRYEIYYKDQYTPYLGISINDSIDYFNRLVKDPDYIDQKRASWVGYISSVSRDLFEITDIGKYLRDIVGSTIKYPTGRYSMAISLVSDILQHKGETGYNMSIGNLPSDIFISKNKGFDNIIEEQDSYIPQTPQTPQSKMPIMPINRKYESSNNLMKKQIIKPIGYIMNYNSSMRNHKIIF